MVCIHDLFARMGGFEHATINYSIHFVETLSPDIYSYNFEDLWSRSKYFWEKKSGIGQEMHLEYLIQFLWEYKIEKKETV